MKHLVSLRKERPYREECGSALLLSEKLVRELPSSFSPKTLIVIDRGKIPALPPAVETYVVTPDIFHKISGLASTDGVAAVVSLPRSSTLENCTKILVVEGVADPGNLGTLLRTALALGWQGVFLLPGCVDLYNDKVLRASRAAPFHLPWREGTLEDLEALITTSRLPLWIADTEGTPLDTLSPKSGCILVLCSEARGPSDALLKLGKRITIPMQQHAESLNVAVAGSILMYYLGRDG